MALSYNVNVRFASAKDHHLNRTYMAYRTHRTARFGSYILSVLSVLLVLFANRKRFTCGFFQRFGDLAVWTSSIANPRDTLLRENV